VPICGRVSLHSSTADLAPDHHVRLTAVKHSIEFVTAERTLSELFWAIYPSLSQLVAQRLGRGEIHLVV